MKKNLEILDYEDKKTVKGVRYVRFKTSEGWMSCFDDKAWKELKGFEGNTACVEIVESGEFNNIKKCYGEAEDLKNVDSDKADVVVEKIGEKPKNGNASMYASYAKDVFCEVYNPLEKDMQATDVMAYCIELVKQAKEAFE